jgi:hypothetical protein
MINMASKSNSVSETTYSKEQIVESRKYGDFAAALLADDRSYTLKEVENLIENYLNSEVR